MRQRQHELATLDELGIVTDTDPSEVTKAGQAQSPPVPPTQHPVMHEEGEAIDG